MAQPPPATAPSPRGRGLGGLAPLALVGALCFAAGLLVGRGPGNDAAVGTTAHVSSATGGRGLLAAGPYSSSSPSVIKVDPRSGAASVGGLEPGPGPRGFEDAGGELSGHSRGLNGEAGDPKLKAVLEKVAINKEVVVAVSNSALLNKDGTYGMLRTWLDGIQYAGVKNYVVICVDAGLSKTLDNIGVPNWHKPPVELADKQRSNHGISATKFAYIKEFLILGYSVLLSDVDIVTLKNPFDKLYRDADIEGLSDGFDPQTAYGWNDVMDDPKMGWSRWAHTMRIFVINSGLFYARANQSTIDLMDRCTNRLAKEKAWDQAVFNEEIWFPSHGDYKGSQVSKRIMDIYDFMNSKTLFRTVRYEARFKTHVPTMVHVNYHPDKWPRMKSIWARYVDGDMTALDKYPVGSCHNAPDC